MLAIFLQHLLKIRMIPSPTKHKQTKTTQTQKLLKNIGTQSVQELFFCDSIRRTVYSYDLVKFFWLRYTARKKLGIYDVHTMLHR